MHEREDSVLAPLLKRIAARFPQSWQHEMRRAFFRREIRLGRFVTDEKEFPLLDRWVEPGDWVLDIGANVGHYTKRMSELAGPEGRVIAFEPVPATFDLLAANARLFPHENVSLLNVAASDRTMSIGIQIPDFYQGMHNYYQASLSPDATDLRVLTISVDALGIRSRIKLVKVDVEGHELPVLRGMLATIERDHPAMIIETASLDVIALIESMGYETERLSKSSNVVCHPGKGHVPSR